MKSFQPNKIVSHLAFTAFALVASCPAMANSEIEELRKELAAQKELIQQLMTAQKNAPAYTPPPVSVEPPIPAAEKVLTFYGIADVGVQNTNSGQGSKWSIGTGGWLASRFGLSVNKPITPDLKAVAVAEAGVQYGTGAAGAASVTPGINNGYASSSASTSAGTQLFGRQIYAGVSSKTFGAVTAGRQYAGTFALNGMTNALAFNGYGYSGSIMGANGMPTRVNNSVVYVSPSLNGFSGQLLYSTGSDNNTNGDVPIAAGSTIKSNDKAGRGLDLEAHYINGPVLVGASTWNFYSTTFTGAETGLSKRSGFQVGGAYDFGPIKVFANYMDGRIKGGGYENVTKAFSKTGAYSLSAMVPFGKHRFFASVTDFNDKSVNNMDAKLYGIGYTYQAEETTKYYIAAGHMNNSAKAAFSLPDGGSLVGNVLTPGRGVTGLMAGVTLGF
ncbi:porin (plasmid) [Diaphorobacter sp. HDW4B]|uniref:porin n=1 Tax=Diaphorobacter sp. HDW4B TaxID=2714925 RepID=UPI00140B05E0|nr:porin [Diaphorobacter sp. HDW4B]QIL74202.1 porin [Diaphorobacter sp. HDW4B]